MKDERIYLRHILECIEAVQDYNIQGRDGFLTNRKTCKATLRELQELAESTQRLSISLREKHSEIPWPAIAGFRNVLVHDYLDINDDIARAIITKRLYATLENFTVQWRQELDALDSDPGQP